MTPAALTPAARESTRSSGLRRSASPAAPRRVSGPARGLTRGQAAQPAPQAPARPAARPARAPAPARPASLPAHALARLAALPDHSLLDRVVRGRFWIPLLGVLLVGIVAMQVEVLKLNAGMGRALERGSALQIENEQLQASVAQLSDVQRIERIAALHGMVMPSPQEIGFLHTGPGTTHRALAAIHPADPSGFAARVSSVTTAALAADSAGTGAASGTTATAGTAAPTQQSTATGG